MISVICLALFVLSVAASSIFPCDVSLGAIKTKTEEANAFRVKCEQSYFTGGECSMYWAKAYELLDMEINFRSCRKQTVDDFLTFLVGSNWTNGEIARQANITRDVVNWNAQQTQLVFTQQSTLTRQKVEEENKNTRQNVTLETTEQNSLTRHNLTLEAQNTRALVSQEAEATRTKVAEESAATRAHVDTEETQTRDLISTEADTTRAFVLVQHQETRVYVSSEANATRDEIVSQNEQTRQRVSEESARTRQELTDVITSEGAASRDNTTAEATATRAHVSQTATATQTVVSNEAQSTRTILTNAINADGSATRNTIAADGASTRATVEAESNSVQRQIAVSTNATTSNINRGVQNITNAIEKVKTSQSNFEDLFIKIMIEGSFSSNPDAGRVDLFQRPASSGGLFETMKAIVLEAVNYNKDKYNLGYSTTYYIDLALGYAQGFETSKNYRKAWEQYRIAYLKAVSS